MPSNASEVPWQPLVARARAQLAAERARLQHQHDQGLPGLQVSAQMTDVFDSIVMQLYGAALQSADRSDAHADLTLVAHSGYGRRDVAPFSDVDIMLLTTTGAESAAAEVARRFTRDVCDVGLHLGFTLRTPAQCAAAAAADATVLTALTEARLLAGNIELFRRFQRRFRRLVRGRRRQLREMIVEARHAERRQYGETVYLLEPNIKRTRGGLRDIQSIRWIGCVGYGQTDLDSLYRLGVLSQSDWQRLRKAYGFLLRLRNELHFHAGKSQDVLTRHEQVRIADTNGYQKIGGVLPVERFMRDYFEHTGDVRYISSHCIAGARTRSDVATAVGTLFTYRLERDLHIGPIHIGATRRGLRKIGTNLTDVLRIMDLANMYRKRIDHRTWEAIRSAMIQRTDTEVSAAAIDRFLSLLSQPGRLADLLRRLHQLRVLEQLIPALQHARCLIQFNDYHKYTVDEHSIRAVQHATDLIHDDSPLGNAYRDIQDKRLLHLALLIHDLGKGYDQDHSEVGEGIASDTARRLGLGERDTDVLRFLVKNHLLMNHIAFRQDLNDESVAVQLAVKVGSPDVLQMLYVHTCADLMAVGPDVLNAWKLELLTELYLRTRQQLTGQDGSADVRLLSDERRAALKTLVPDYDAWWQHQVKSLPSTILLDDAPEHIFAMLQSLRRLDANEAMAWYRYLPQRAVSVYTVGTSENVTPGIFHKLTGALSAKGLQILSAEIHTLADDMVLDQFYVQDPDFAAAPSADRVDQIRQALTASLADTTDNPPTFRRLWQTEVGARAADFAHMPTEIRFDDVTSSQHTIITIFTYDRRGLLYRIARTLFELGLSVHVAKIGTYLDQVVDVFYVTDAQGRKVYDDQWLADIRRRLTEAINVTEEPG